MRGSKRILCLTQFYLPDIGGMQISNSLIVEGLERHGYEIELHVFGQCEGVKKSGSLTRYDHPYALRSLAGHLRMAFTILRRIRLWCPTLVLIMDEGPLRALGMLPFVKRYESQIVSVNSGATPVRKNIHFKGRLNAWLVLRGYRWLEKMFISEDTFEKLKKKYLYLAQKLNVLGRPVPDYYFSSTKVLELLGSTGRPPVLFSAGRAAKDKAVDLIINALALLRDKCGVEVAEFVFAGDGPELETWRALAFSHRLKKVRFVGNVAHDEIMHHYDAAHFFIMPSKNEGETFGRVWVEAFARRRPAISTGICNLKYLLKDGINGIIVQPTVESVAEGIERALSLTSKQYMEMCDEAYITSLHYKQSMVVDTLVRLLAESR